jgi:chitinase
VALTGMVLSGAARWVQPGGFSGDDSPREPSSSREAAEDLGAPAEVDGPGAGQLIVGNFSEWGVYENAYHVKDIDESGAADQLTHIVYAFGMVQDGECRIDDSQAAYEARYTAEDSVAGVDDPGNPDGEASSDDPESSSTGSGPEASDGDQVVRGSFNQLRQLKEEHPDLKVLWSFGGWFGSGGWTPAAEDPVAFAQSCYDLVEDPRWADVFDGIVIDWEFPNWCAEVCDASGFDAYRELIEAVRARFGPDNEVVGAIPGDATEGGPLDAADYAGAAPYVDFYMVLTLDYFGPWEPGMPTAVQSPLTDYDGIPIPGLYGDAAIQNLLDRDVPADKLLLGVAFFGEGWTGVSSPEPGATATGAASATFEERAVEYRRLAETCPPTGTVAGTAYAVCGDEWWSYDTPETLTTKMGYVLDHGLGGAHFWELRGDTDSATLVTALHDALALAPSTPSTPTTTSPE